MVRRWGISAKVASCAYCPCTLRGSTRRPRTIAGIGLTLVEARARNRHMLLDHEIAEERSVEHLGIKVHAPSGWVLVTHVCKTVPLRVWEVVTISHRLLCAGKHLVITPRGPVCADQLAEGILIITASGYEAVRRVTDTGEDRPLYDLRVDHPDHVYFTDGIASHNSTGLCAAELFKLNVIPNYKSLYIAPLVEHTKTLADKMMDMQRGSVVPPSYITSRGLRNNMYYKESAKGGSLKLMHVLTDSNKIRGNSCQTVLVDECLVGSTPIARVGESLSLTDLEPGDAVLAHSHDGTVIEDSVLRITPKGSRHTWEVRTKLGLLLVCTGNERFRTPTGWRYLAEFIDPVGASACPVTNQIKATGRCCPGIETGLPLGRLFSAAVPICGAGGLDGNMLDCLHPDTRIMALSMTGDCLAEDEIVSIAYAGLQAVYDVETENHHTLFAGGVAVHNCQDFDAEHLPEISQVQKAFRDSKATIFAGTSKDLDTCLEHQFQLGSRGIWHLRCECKDKWHPLNDAELIPKLMSVDGLVCPNNGRLLNPLRGEFIHEDQRMLAMKQVSFHLPQVIVPEYASGPAFMDIWRDFKRYPYKKFLQEVMGIAVASGMSELTEADLKACCSDKTFGQIQADYLSGKTRYAYVFSGCDWGGSDWNAATKTKQSYTVHTIYGLTADVKMELIYAFRYAGMNYREIAGHIVEAHNKFKAFAIGTDNGGGSYYNAHLRDCGRILTNRIISFNYTDTKLLLERIPHPEAHIMSLHRSDSISALINDIKQKNIRFPRWDDSAGFVLDCLNMRRNITESQSGRSVMRYVRHGAKADDFMQSTNYAVMMKRIITHEPLIPNRQILSELAGLFGTAPAQVGATEMVGMVGGYFSG